jgi:hypothetical protein
MTTYLENFIARAGISAHYQRNGRIALHRGSRRLPTIYTREDWLGQRPEAVRLTACLLADLAVEPRRRGQWLSLWRKFLGGDDLYRDSLAAIHRDGLVDVSALVRRPARLRVRLALRAAPEVILGR